MIFFKDMALSLTVKKSLLQSSASASANRFKTILPKSANYNFGGI
jgi:hypothetical protein